MARPKKATKRVDRPRDSRPVRELKEDLGLDEPAWQEFLRHALDGFTDFENAHDPGHDSRLRLSEVPTEWFEQLDPLGHVTLRVLREARQEIAVRVAYCFVQVGLPEPDDLYVPPGLGASWLYLARHEVECPVEPRDLARLALQLPQEFFSGVQDDDVIPLCRLVLQALEPIDVPDLHALLIAIATARRGDRAIFHLFKDIMRSDRISPKIKGELCRGVLECPEEINRMARWFEEGRLGFQSTGASASWLLLLTASPAFYMLHDGLKRHAVAALVDHAGEPLRDVIDAYFLKTHGNMLAAISMSEGAVDLIRDHAQELDDDVVQRLLSRAIKSSWAPVREAAYRAGAERFGREYARPALKDPTRQVRNWAEKYLASGKTKRRSRSKPE
jgi:hypothetical protein